MKSLSLQQGSPEWHAHRATHFNASDAAAMLGCFPYMTRSELLHALHTGIRPEVTPEQQRRFEKGHEIEAKNRPLAEAIIGEDLYPMVGAEGEMSASFDGLTVARETNWECKSLNADLRTALPNTGPDGNDAAKLPKMYRVQMEQQCLVSGATRALFTASDGQDDDRHCWYTPDHDLRAEIVAGWKQFAADLVAYVPPAASPIVVAVPVQALPAVFVQVTGTIVIHENFDAFEVAAVDFIEHRLIRNPKNDQDFADLEVQIKAMKGAEAALDSAEEGWIAQIDPVSAAKRRKDMLHKLMRDNRLMAEKLMTNEKERRRGEIVAGGITALREHVHALNVRIGEQYMPHVPADFGGVIRGMKSLSSMEDKVMAELARSKSAANEIADRVQANMQALVVAGDKASFPDAATLVLKAPDDLRAIIAERVTETERKLEAQRQAIRAEEQAKAEKAVREQEEARQDELRREQEASEAAAPPATTAPVASAAPALSSTIPITNLPHVAGNVSPLRSFATAGAPVSPPTLKLGEINARIAPLSIDAAGLALLGFPHASTDRAAKLFHEAEFGRMLDSIIAHLRTVQQRQLQAA